MQTTSAVSVDPTEALSKKYRELEEEYEKKRALVEEEIARNDEKVRDLIRIELIS